MKKLYILILFLLSTLTGKGQDTIPEHYFDPHSPFPKGIEKPHPEAVKQQFKDIPILFRTYISLEGIGRFNTTELSNNYNFMLVPSKKAGIGVGGNVGIVFREQFSLETGYSHSPVYNYVQLNTTNDGSFELRNKGHTFSARGKVFLDFDKIGTQRSGLWIGAGLWAIPSNGGTRPRVAYQIVSHDPYVNQIDTTYIISNTDLATKWTWGIEATAEYLFHLNEWLGMSFYIRYLHATQPTITSTLTYSTNSQKDLATNVLTSTGTGATVGISLRFTTKLRRKAGDEQRIQKRAPALLEF